MRIKPIPFERVPDQTWSSALCSLNRYSAAPLSNQNIHRTGVLLIWDIGQHWAYKMRWDRKHKIPYHRNLTTCIKPLGEMLYHLAELTTRCHADIPAGTVPFGNGAEWYAAVSEECRQDDISSGWRAVQSNRGKKAGIARHRGILAVLKDYRNPYDPKHLPCLHQLVGIALGLAEQSNIFDRKYWRPFLDAYTRFVTSLDKDGERWGVLIEKQAKLYMASGRGKGSRLLFPK